MKTINKEMRDLKNGVDLNGVTYIAYKNAFGYDVRQLMIDYSKREFQIGSFKMRCDDYVTRAKFNEVVQDLKLLSFKEV